MAPKKGKAGASKEVTKPQPTRRSAQSKEAMAYVEKEKQQGAVSQSSETSPDQPAKKQRKLWTEVIPKPKTPTQSSTPSKTPKQPAKTTTTTKTIPKPTTEGPSVSVDVSKPETTTNKDPQTEEENLSSPPPNLETEDQNLEETISETPPNQSPRIHGLDINEPPQQDSDTPPIITTSETTMSHTITPSSVLDNVVKPTTTITSEIPNVPQQDAVAVSIPEPNPRTVGNDPILNALLQTPEHSEAEGEGEAEAEKDGDAKGEKEKENDGDDEQEGATEVRKKKKQDKVAGKKVMAEEAQSKKRTKSIGYKRKPTKKTKAEKAKQILRDESEEEEEEMEYQERTIRFSCKGAENKYLLYKTRYGHVDKGFTPGVVSTHLFIRKPIEALGWKILCTPPPKHNIDWVREFYAEAAM